MTEFAWIQIGVPVKLTIAFAFPVSAGYCSAEIGVVYNEFKKYRRIAIFLVVLLIDFRFCFKEDSAVVTAQDLGTANVKQTAPNPTPEAT